MTHRDAVASPRLRHRRPGSYSRILPLHSRLEYVLKSGHVSHATLGMNWSRYRLNILEEVNTLHKCYQHMIAANFPLAGEIVKPRAASAPGYEREKSMDAHKSGLSMRQVES